MPHIVKYILVLIMAFVFCEVSAQKETDKKFSLFGKSDSTYFDTNYIASYYNVFTLRFLMTNKKNNFTILDNVSEKSIEYLPNSTLNLGFGLTYKWLGLDLSFNLPFLNRDDEIYGNTKRFDLQSSIFKRKLVVNFFLQSYKGYYVANPTLIDPGWQPGNPYPTRRDINSFAIGGTYTHIFNHNKFSYRAAFSFNERQKKMAGSFTLSGGILYYKLSSDTGLVPDEIFEDSVSVINFDEIKISSAFVLGGYIHTFIVRNWYFTLSLGIGGGLSSTKTKYVDNQLFSRKSKLSIVTDFRGSVGYNSDTFYVGLSWLSGTFAINPTDNINVNYSLSKINFYVGYRFYKWFNKSK